MNSVLIHTRTEQTLATGAAMELSSSFPSANREKREKLDDKESIYHSTIGHLLWLSDEAYCVCESVSRVTVAGG